MLRKTYARMRPVLTHCGYGLRKIFLPQTPWVLPGVVVYMLWGAWCIALCASVWWVAVSVQAPGTVVAIHAQRFIPGVHASAIVFSVLSALLYVLLFWVQISKRQMRMLFRASIVVLSVVICITLNIHPTRSQDAYWNLLLARGYSEYQLNPYTTTPNMLVRDSWSASVFAWRTQSMSHGMLWTAPLVVITSFTTQLTTALVMLKVWLWCAYAALAYVMWRAVCIRFSDRIEAQRWWIFIMAQPVWIQYVGIDMHNDVFVALSLLMSYLYIREERYSASAFALLIGGMIKYVPLLALPIPLYLAWKRSRNRAQYITEFRLFGVCALLACILFFTVQYSPRSTLGLYTEIAQRGATEFALLGSQIVRWLCFGSDAALRIVGLLLAFIVLGLCVWYRRIAQAYILPFAVVLLCGTPWFQSWYGLWILPLLLFVCDAWVVALAGVMLMVMHEVVMPAQAHQVVVLLFLVAALIYALRRGVLLFKK